MTVFIDTVSEIEIIDISERGKPNRECILLRVKETCQAGNFLVILAVKNEEGNLIPLKDSLIWFGENILTAGDWIFLYTCPGEYRTNSMTDRPGTLHSCYWGRNITIFHDPKIYAVIVKMGEFTVSPAPSPPTAKLQYGNGGLLGNLEKK